METISILPFELRVLLASSFLPDPTDIRYRFEILDEFAHYHLDWFSIATAPDSVLETYRQNAAIAAAVAAVPQILIEEYYDTASFLEILYAQAPVYCKPALAIGPTIQRFWDLVEWYHDLLRIVRIHYPVPEYQSPPAPNSDCDVDW